MIQKIDSKITKELAAVKIAPLVKSNADDLILHCLESCAAVFIWYSFTKQMQKVKYEIIWTKYFNTRQMIQSAMATLERWIISFLIKLWYSVHGPCDRVYRGTQVRARVACKGEGGGGEGMKRRVLVT